MKKLIPWILTGLAVVIIIGCYFVYLAKEIQHPTPDDPKEFHHTISM